MNYLSYQKKWLPPRVKAVLGEVHQAYPDSSHYKNPCCISLSGKCLESSLRSIKDRLLNSNIVCHREGSDYFYDILSTVYSLDSEYKKLEDLCVPYELRNNNRNVRGNQMINYSTEDLLYLNLAANSILKVLDNLKNNLLSQIGNGLDFDTVCHTKSLIHIMECKLYGSLKKLEEITTQSPRKKFCCSSFENMYRTNSLRKSNTNLQGRKMQSNICSFDKICCNQHQICKHYEKERSFKKKQMINPEKSLRTQCLVSEDKPCFISQNQLQISKVNNKKGYTEKSEDCRKQFHINNSGPKSLRKASGKFHKLKPRETKYKLNTVVNDENFNLADDRTHGTKSLVPYYNNHKVQPEKVKMPPEYRCNANGINIEQNYSLEKTHEINRSKPKKVYRPHKNEQYQNCIKRRTRAGKDQSFRYVRSSKRRPSKGSFNDDKRRAEHKRERKKSRNDGSASSIPTAENREINDEKAEAPNTYSRGPRRLRIYSSKPRDRTESTKQQRKTSPRISNSGNSREVIMYPRGFSINSSRPYRKTQTDRDNIKHKAKATYSETNTSEDNPDFYTFTKVYKPKKKIYITKRQRKYLPRKINNAQFTEDSDTNELSQEKITVYNDPNALPTGELWDPCTVCEPYTTATVCEPCIPRKYSPGKLSECCLLNEPCVRHDTCVAVRDNYPQYMDHVDDDNLEICPLVVDKQPRESMYQHLSCCPWDESIQETKSPAYTPLYKTESVCDYDVCSICRPTHQEIDVQVSDAEDTKEIRKSNRYFIDRRQSRKSSRSSLASIVLVKGKQINLRHLRGKSYSSNSVDSIRIMRQRRTASSHRIIRSSYASSRRTSSESSPSFISIEKPLPVKKKSYMYIYYKRRTQKGRHRKYVKVGKFLKERGERVIEYDFPVPDQGIEHTPVQVKTYSIGTSTEVLPSFTKRTSTSDLINIVKAIGTNTQRVITKEQGIDPIPQRKISPPKVTEVKNKLTNTEKVNLRTTGTDSKPRSPKPTMVNVANDPLYYLAQRTKDTNTVADPKKNFKETGTNPKPIEKVQQRTVATEPVYLEKQSRHTNTLTVRTTNAETETLPKATMFTVGTDPVREQMADKNTSYDRVKTTDRANDPIPRKTADKGEQFDTLIKKPQVRSVDTRTDPPPSLVGIGIQTSFVDKGRQKSPVYEIGTQTTKTNVKQEYQQTDERTTSIMGTQTTRLNVNENYQQTDEKPTSIAGTQTTRINVNENYQQTDQKPTSMFGTQTERENVNEVYQQTDEKPTSILGTQTGRVNVNENYQQTDEKSTTIFGTQTTRINIIENYQQTDEKPTNIFGTQTTRISVNEKYQQTDEKPTRILKPRRSWIINEPPIKQQITVKKKKQRPKPETPSESVSSEDPSELSMHLMFEKCHDEIYKRRNFFVGCKTKARQGFIVCEKRRSNSIRIRNRPRCETACEYEQTPTIDSRMFLKSNQVYKQKTRIGSVNGSNIRSCTRALTDEQMY